MTAPLAGTCAKCFGFLDDLSIPVYSVHVGLPMSYAYFHQQCIPKEAVEMVVTTSNPQNDGNLLVEFDIATPESTGKRTWMILGEQH